MIFTELYFTAFEFIIKLRLRDDGLDCRRRSENCCGKTPVATLSDLVIWQIQHRKILNYIKRVREEDLRGLRESPKV